MPFPVILTQNSFGFNPLTPLVVLPVILVSLVTFILELLDMASSSCAIFFLQHFTLRAVLGIVDLPAQPEVLSTLVGTLGVTHLQGHSAVVALVCARLLVIYGTSRSRGSHASLQETENIVNPLHLVFLLDVICCPRQPLHYGCIFAL